MVWNFEDNTLNPNEIKLYKYLKSNCNPRVAENLTKFLSLHDYLKNSHFRNPEELRARVRINGGAFFTAKQAQTLYEKHALSGGALAIDTVALTVANMLYNWMPMFATRFIDTWQPTLMMLKGMVEDPDFGPIIGTALDAMTGLIPTAVVSIESIAAEVGGPPGAIIGYGIGSIAALLGVLTHVSMGELGQAFMLLGPLIPGVGLSLYSFLNSGSQLLEKTLDKEEQLLVMIERQFNAEVAGLVKEIINDWTNPPLNPRPLFQKVQGFLPPELPRAASALSGASSSLFPYAMSAVSGVTKFAEAIPTAVQAIERLIPTAQNRLSGGKHSTAKWRTQRRLRR